MKHSTERILTTHTGSLPRPEVLAQLMIAKEQGKTIDVKELEDNVHSAVAEVVKNQVDIGIDIISDGEMSKIGFANYVKDRLTGFGGKSNPVVAQRIVRFAQVVGRENVIAGTDCGFGTFLGTSVIVPSVAWDKLRSLAEGARLASEELW